MAHRQLPSVPRPRLALLCAALVLLVGAVYGRTAGHSFVDYDDPAYVLENPHVRSGLALENVGWAFRAGYHANWHPLTWLSHMLDVRALRPRPRGPSPRDRVALHALNACSCCSRSSA